VRKTVKKKLGKAVEKKAIVKRPRPARWFESGAANAPPRKVLNEHPGNLVVDASDHSAVEAVARLGVKANRAGRVRRFTATDVAAAAASSGETPAGSMVERVNAPSNANLTKIERIVGNPERLVPAQRIETESRAACWPHWPAH
jgi:hypothetical protein